MLILKSWLAELKAKVLMKVRLRRWIRALERFRKAHPEYAPDEHGNFQMLDPRFIAFGRMIDLLSNRPPDDKDGLSLFAESRDYDKLLTEAHRLVQEAMKDDPYLRDAIAGDR